MGGWEVTKLASKTTTDLFSTMLIQQSSKISYTDLDFLYSGRLVYKSTDNKIAVTSATTGVKTFYTVSSGLSTGNVLSM